MHLDLKIQQKILGGKFHFTKNALFHNFCKNVAQIFESLS